ncbi:MAG: Na+/H+ antiporter subunit E [Desulfuromonadales bacterium]|nr:Na+/H+ antiporter subunit E [Desulfuromonadales bacterium]
MPAKFATFFIMLLFWVVLSGMFDGFHLTLGVISCALVAHFSHRLLFPDGKIGPWARDVSRLTLYLPFLFKEIVVANLQVARIVLHPRMLDLIDPRLVSFKTRLKRPLSRVTFGQSITLTPATITVSIDDDVFTVYSLTRSAAESLPGEMEKRVAAALEEQP